MKRIPRKKKKELKKRDPELYRVMHIFGRIGYTADELASALRELSIILNSAGGTIANATKFYLKIQ